MRMVSSYVITLCQIREKDGTLFQQTLVRVKNSNIIILANRKLNNG
jgi:hypothetical protein